MKTFVCPKCKQRITETRYIHIKGAACKNCKKDMIILHKPGKNHLESELKICLLEQK